MTRKPKSSPNTIAVNKRARFEYALQERFEAGLVLTGWEVKSLRASKVQITDAYVILQNAEAFLVGCNINPLQTVSAHLVAQPGRARKLLLHRRELAKLVGAIQAKGQTCVATRLYWKNNHVKLEIHLAVGKKMHDKRASMKERDWNRDKQRLLKAHSQ